MSTATTNNLLHNAIYLVTGAANGLGRALSLELATQGVTVIAVDKDLRRLETLYDEIVAQSAAQPILHPMDFAKAQLEDYETFGQALQEQFERLDGIIHNAALFTGFTPLQQYKPEVWFEIIQANLHAPFLITKATLALLGKSNQAQAVFIDDDSDDDVAYWGAYGVAKAGMRQFMRTLSDEYEQTIKCFGYRPEAMQTALYGKMYPAAAPQNLNPPEAVAQHLVELLANPARVQANSIVKFAGT